MFILRQKLVATMVFTSAFITWSALSFASSGMLSVTDGAFTIPARSQAVLTLKSTADFDLRCDVKVVGVIHGHDPVTGAELTARQASDSVQGFILKAGRLQERSFDFKAVVQHMQEVWGDSLAVLVEVDANSLSSECQRDNSPTVALCSWAGASVKAGEWLECPTCKYRFCQCQANSSWGQCGGSEPSQGSCDWSNPDWSNPACQTGGSKPCDWSNPDWSNPACNP